MYENFVGTWETVRNREVSVLERCPHGEVVRIREVSAWRGSTQSNLSNTDTEGTEQSVRIREVSVLERSRRLRHF